MSSKTKVGMYSGAKKPKVFLCDVHGLWADVLKGCTVCQTNAKPDPKR